MNHEAEDALRHFRRMVSDMISGMYPGGWIRRMEDAGSYDILTRLVIRRNSYDWGILFVHLRPFLMIGDGMNVNDD